MHDNPRQYFRRHGRVFRRSHRRPGVLTIAVNYTLNLLKKKDEQLMAKDARIEALMDRLIDKCPNCELAKAANKSLLDDE